MPLPSELLKSTQKGTTASSSGSFLPSQLLQQVKTNTYKPVQTNTKTTVSSNKPLIAKPLPTGVVKITPGATNIYDVGKNILTGQYGKDLVSSAIDNVGKLVKGVKFSLTDKKIVSPLPSELPAVKPATPIKIVPGQKKIDPTALGLKPDFGTNTAASSAQTKTTSKSLQDQKKTVDTNTKILNEVKKQIGMTKNQIGSAFGDLMTKGVVPNQDQVAPKSEYRNQADYQKAVKENKTDSVSKEVNKFLGLQVATAPAILVGGWLVDPVTEAIAARVPEGTSILTNILSQAAKGAIKASPYGTLSAALPAKSNEERAKNTALGVAGTALVGMALAGAGAVASELVNKFGQDGVNFLANRELIQKVVLGKGTPEEVSHFNFLNESGLSAEAARAKEGISINTTTQKQGAMWDILRDLFSTNYKAAPTEAAGATQKIQQLLGEGEKTPQEVLSAVMKAGEEKSVEGKAIIKAALEAQKNEKNIVISKDVQALANEHVAKATQADAGFKKQVESVAKEVNAEVIHGPVKKAERVAEKAIGDYSGDVSRVKDINRSTLVIDDLKNFDGVVSKVTEKFGDPVRVKNIDNGVGYKKAIINVKTPEGVTAEIQVTTPEMAKAKQELHHLYEQVRVKAEGWEAGQEEMNRVYAEARASEARRLNSSADISSPSPNALNGAKSAPETVLPKTSLPSESTVTNVSSTSKNLGNVGADINKPPSTSSIPNDTNKGNISKLKDLNTNAQVPVGEGKWVPSKAYERVYNRMVESGQDVSEMLTPGEVGQNRTNMRKDSERAVDFVAKDPQAAIRVALGLEKPPEGQLERNINFAVADLAREEGNMNLFTHVEATGSLRQTRRGKEIAADRGRFTDNSPHTYMKELLNRRLLKLGGSVGDAISQSKEKLKTVSDRAFDKIDREVSKIQEKINRDRKKIGLAQDFLDKLKCK